MPFAYTSGNPDNLTGGAAARMQDIQGPFYDLRAWLNSSTGGGAAAGGFVDVTAGLSLPVLDVGLLGQLRAGRQLALADFSAMGLSVPVGLWNLGDLTNLGTGGALVNKGAVPFGVGVNGLSTTAAQFAGSTGQALYIADTGAADPFRIKTGSWGAWVRTAKRAVGQRIIAKLSAAAGSFAYDLNIGSGATANAAQAAVSLDGNTLVGPTGVSDVADDRWHHLVGTHDGTAVRLYVDGVLEGVTAAAGVIIAAGPPLNIGAFAADGGAAANGSHYGRVDEAFVTPDVLTDDQIRNLYCARIAHTLGAAPTRVKLNVRRLRKGATLATTDFPATPVRLHNFTTGALTDQGTGGVTLTVAGNPPLSVAGADGTKDGAYSLSAGGRFNSTDAGLPAGTAARSYGCWFKITGTLGWTLLSWGGVAGSTDARLWVGGAGGVTILCSNGADNIGGPVVADGQWHHVVASEDNAAGDGVRRKLYLDGRFVGGSTVLNAITLGGAAHFVVGANVDGTSAWVGQIDGVFVTGTALTFEQVAALYAKGTQSLGPSPKNPGDHIEGFDSTSVYVTFDSLDSQHQVDLSVGS